MMFPYPFLEAAYMAKMCGGGANIQPLTVTENKEYNAADYGCDGFDPVLVNVPDRYDEGYQKGVEDGKNSKTISALSVTENKTYNASDYSCDGFDPVNVNVPTKEKELQDKEKELQDLEDYFKSKYPDEADNIDTILGNAEFCKAEVEGAKYSFTYRAVRGKFNDSRFGPDCDTYDATIYVTRSDGKEYTRHTTINAFTSQGGSDPTLYGCDDFSKCFFWSYDEGLRYVYLNYRFSSYGSWSSYDQWDSDMYKLYD